MKYFKTFEGFKKEYMTKIDLKDFKKIKWVYWKKF